MATQETILEHLAGMPRREALALLAETIGRIIAADDVELVGVVTPARRPVPTRQRSPGRFEQVWRYLETLPEYTSQKKLRAALIARFGKAETPSKSHLSRYLVVNSIRRG